LDPVFGDEAEDVVNEVSVWIENGAAKSLLDVVTDKELQ
jgi:hypothetical protein